MRAATCQFVATLCLISPNVDFVFSVRPSLLAKDHASPHAVCMFTIRSRPPNTLKTAVRSNHVPRKRSLLILILGAWVRPERLHCGTIPLPSQAVALIPIAEPGSGLHVIHCGTIPLPSQAVALIQIAEPGSDLHVFHCAQTNL